MIGRIANKQEYTQLSLDIKAKGDKFLYYKRRIELVEKTIKVFPFWNNVPVWAFISFSLTSLYFLLFLIDQSFARLHQTIPLILFENAYGAIRKEYVYLLFFLPLINFVVTLFLSYKLYNSRKYMAYTLIVANSVCTLLFIITLMKFIQMNYAIIS